jgi:hypothetical protein
MRGYLLLFAAITVSLLAGGTAIFNYLFSGDAVGSLALFLKAIGVALLIGSPFIASELFARYWPSSHRWSPPSSTTTALHPSTFSRKKTAATMGAEMGARAGFFLSALYSTPLVLPFLFFPPVFALAILVSIVIGISPSVLLGWVTGRIIGWALSRWNHTASQSTAIMLGVGVCTTFAVVIQLLLKSSTPSIESDYWLLLGIPSIIYVLAGGWMGRAIYITERLINS